MLSPLAIDADATLFAQRLRCWYEVHQRDLPWRGIHDPYRIWISEIILQQTRVAQGLAYYHRFIEAFPTVEHLAQSSQEQVLRLWQGLGYYSRARNLHTAAQQVVARGAFPNDYKGLLQLKGVGEYTAAAVASFAYNEPCAVLDGNVYRVLARYFGIELPIDKPQGQRYFKELAYTLLDVKHPGDYNQAIMDFGALQCTPTTPDCATCPLVDSCVALAQGSTQRLPYKEGRTAVRDRYLVYVYLYDALGDTLLWQRPAGDIWQGLYEPLLLEFEHEPTQTDVHAHHALSSLALTQGGQWYKLGSMYKHILSHQRLWTSFYAVSLPTLPSPLPQQPPPYKDAIRVSLAHRGDYAVSRLVEILYERLSLMD